MKQFADSEIFNFSNVLNLDLEKSPLEVSKDQLSIMRKYSAPQRRKINYYELIKTEKMSRDRNLYTPTTVKFLSKEQNFSTSYP